MTGLKLNELTQDLVKLLVDVAKSAEENQKDYFIGGGFAIDLSLGRITRQHHDIDFHPMLEDSEWWQEWFGTRGYKILKREGEDFPEVWKVFGRNGKELVDMWPFKSESGKLLIKYKGNYVDSERQIGELRTVDFQGTRVKIENPIRVLEQKLRHVKRGSKLRPQDKHDFSVLGKNNLL